MVVCAWTHDRWESIVDGLGSLRDQERAPEEVLLVIDHHPELLARCRRELPGLLGLADGDRDRPRLRVLPNRRTRGLSGARNSGVEVATGDVVAFLDDDAVPEPDWTARLLGGYDADDVLAVGGMATPVWPQGRPPHLVGELDWVVGCSYVGLPEHRSEVRNLLGAGMSFRRSALETAGDFDELAGRVGTLPLGCEETELCIRLRQRVPGGRIVLDPRAVVRHHVGRERTTWGYLVRRSYAEGVSKAAVARTVGTADATRTERDYVRRTLPAALSRELGAGVRGERSGLAGAAGIVLGLGATVAGYLRGRVRGNAFRAGARPPASRQGAAA